MARFAYIVLTVAVVTVYSAQARSRRCSANEFWNSCGSGCETRCIQPADGLMCPAVCEAKCSCKPGYVIGPHGNCITMDECAALNPCTDRNQVWNECGSYCEARCNEPEDGQGCATVCVPKCSCKPGYVIGPDGTCITKDQCHAS